MPSTSTTAPSVGAAPAAALLRPYVCGATSAVMASVAVHPVDLTKVRMQLIGVGTRSVRPSAITIASNAVRSDGVRALYAGLSAAATRQAIYGTARIGLHTAFSNQMRAMQGGGDLPLYKSFAASFASGAIASFAGNPFDVALVRMQADGLKKASARRNYRGVLDAMYRIASQEGVRSLWSGFTPTLARAVAMNVGMMASYDQAKQAIVKVNGYGMTTNLASSAIAGFFCAAVALPFDLIKTRMQDMKTNPKTGVRPYKNVLDCGMRILAKEGPAAFWRGFVTFYARCAPHAMIILLAREHLFEAYDASFGTAGTKRYYQ